MVLELVSSSPTLSLRLPLPLRLAALRGVLRRAHGRQLRSQLHEQRHQCVSRLVNDGGELGVIHLPEVLQSSAAREEGGQHALHVLGA